MAAELSSPSCAEPAVPPPNKGGALTPSYDIRINFGHRKLADQLVVSLKVWGALIRDDPVRKHEEECRTAKEL